LKDINKIINKYLDGNSSKEEEIILKDFLLKYDLPIEHTYLKDLFDYYENERQIKAPIDFDENLFEKINQQNQRKHKIRKVVNYSISSVAACMIVFLGVLYFINLSDKDYQSELDVTVYQDNMLNTTRQAFSIMNYYMDKGLSPMQEMEKLNQGKDELQKLEKFYEYKSKVFEKN